MASPMTSKGAIHLECRGFVATSTISWRNFIASVYDMLVKDRTLRLSAFLSSDEPDVV